MLKLSYLIELRMESHIDLCLRLYETRVYAAVEPGGGRRAGDEPQDNGVIRIECVDLRCGDEFVRGAGQGHPRCILRYVSFLPRPQRGGDRILLTRPQTMLSHHIPDALRSRCVARNRWHEVRFLMQSCQDALREI
jgi:hypothetical protein